MIGLVRLEQDLLIERGMLNVCGNDDRVLFSPVEELSSSQRYTQEQHAIVVAMMTILDGLVSRKLVRRAKERITRNLHLLDKQ